MACTKYFHLTHGMPPERFISHPNQYFEESQNIKSGKADGSKRVPITASKQYELIFTQVAVVLFNILVKFMLNP